MWGWTITQVPTDYTPLIIIFSISVGIVIVKEIIQWKIKSKKKTQHYSIKVKQN